jgi:hypothetical protein
MEITCKHVQRPIIRNGRHWWEGSYAPCVIDWWPVANGLFHALPASGHVVNTFVLLYVVIYYVEGNYYHIAVHTVWSKDLGVLSSYSFLSCTSRSLLRRKYIEASCLYALPTLHTHDRQSLISLKFFSVFLLCSFFFNIVDFNLKKNIFKTRNSTTKN